MKFLHSLLGLVMTVGLLIFLPPVTLRNIMADLAIILGTVFLLSAIRLIPSYQGRHRDLGIAILCILALGSFGVGLIILYSW